MMAGFEQRCWNHENREAVCQCPECGRSYCRECVSEHQSRLLCAACLTRVSQSTVRRRSSLGRLAAPLLAFGGLLLAWMVLFGAGESIIILAEHAEQSSWQNH